MKNNMIYAHNSIIIAVLLITVLLSQGCHSTSLSPQVKTIRHEEWFEDPRTKLLESAIVGALPSGEISGPRLLAHYNSRVISAGLPSFCRVVFCAPPDVLISDSLWRDIISPNLAYMNLLEPIGVTSDKYIRSDLEKLNLRQFLWLICRAYSMEVIYENLYITVGYGTFAHHYISPGKLQGDSQKSNETNSLNGALSF